jgi:hypothetical protein
MSGDASSAQDTILVHFSPTPPMREGDLKLRLPVVPREGDVVELFGTEGQVRTVVWYPQGTEDTTEPFVYVVVRMPS